MKRRWLIILIAIVLCLLIGGFLLIKNIKKLDKNKVKEIILKDLGINDSNVSMHIELETEHGKKIYEVDFTLENTKYEYEIDAKDGSIIKKEVEKKKENASENNQNVISIEAAKEKALSDASLDVGSVTFVKEKKDYDDGILVYEIEFYTSKNINYEYEINAVTGEIRKKQIRMGEENEKIDTSNLITKEKAKEIALIHANVSDVNFKEIKLDYEKDKLVYEIEFFKDNTEYEYEIDALTGDVIKYSSEKER